MTDAAPPPDRPARPASALRSIAEHRATGWAAFSAVHAWLAFLNLHGPGYPIGDVTLVYRHWIDQALLADYWVGVDAVWVYPIVAIAPMLAAASLGMAHYAGAWLLLVTLLDAVGFAAITGWRRSRRRASIGWWWLGFLVLFGPIALVRIDSVTVPLAIVGVLLLATRPRAAAVVLAAATWIKVWPAALIAAVVISSRQRGAVFAAAALSSAAVVAVALAFGSGANVFSFVTQQTGRGLQVEAPVTTFWLWQALAGVPGASVYYDTDILTFQVQGAEVATVAAVMTPLLALAVLGVAGLGIRAALRRAATAELLPPLALALVATLIAVNKVGSPQFIGWLVVPVVLGLATNTAGRGVPFRTPAVIVLVLAALTQLVYPYFYDDLLGLNPLLLGVLTARNVLLFVLLGWAVRELVVLGRRPVRKAGDNGGGYDNDGVPIPVDPVSPWPLSRSHRDGADPSQP